MEIKSLKSKKIVIIISIIFLFLVLFMYGLLGKGDKEALVEPPEELLQSDEPIPNDEVEVSGEILEIVVDVKGAVNKQGVYRVNSELRVEDVIILAGGFLENADTTKVNLAAKLLDEMVVYVPVIGEEGVEANFHATMSGEQDGSVRLNAATMEELQTLTGIGPAKAAAIISYRDEHGPFDVVEDLLNVNGIGEKTLEKIKGQLVVK